MHVREMHVKRTLKAYIHIRLAFALDVELPGAGGAAHEPKGVRRILTGAL